VILFDFIVSLTNGNSDVEHNSHILCAQPDAGYGWCVIDNPTAVGWPWCHATKYSNGSTTTGLWMCIQNATNHSTLFLDQPIPKAPFTQYILLSIRFDNRLYRIYKHSTGCQNRLSNRLYRVYSQLSNRFDNRLDVCLDDTAGCQTSCTTVVSCKRGISYNAVSVTLLSRNPSHCHCIYAMCRAIRLN